MYAPNLGHIATPIGLATVREAGGVLQSITIGLAPGEPGLASPLINEALAQIEAWFAGLRTDFALPLAPAASARGAALRSALIALPYGETISYGALARLTASGARAIGQACARNPFPLIVPCHRVTAAGGKLGAYSAANGPNSKAWLIAHEAHHVGHFRHAASAS